MSTAANRDNGSVLPPPADFTARGGTLKAALNHLLARGLVEKMPVGSDAESWRRDDDAGRSGLCITAAGYSAIGVEAADAGPAASGPDLPVREGSASRLATYSSGFSLDCSVPRHDETEAADDDPLDGTITWTDEGVEPVASESDASVDRVPTGASSPRAPSKQD